MILVADKTQNLYERSQSWIDEAMKGAGFSGSWSELSVSYRMPVDYTPAVVEYAEKFIKANDRIIPEPQQSLELCPTVKRWHQVPKDQDNEVNACAEQVLNFYELMKKDEQFTFSDIVFLTWKRKTGIEVVRKLGGKGIKVKHTFGLDDQGEDRKRGEDAAARGQKVGFFQGSEKVKATTIHSYKGWESTCMVLHIGEASSDGNKAAIYAALTRLKASEDPNKGSRLAVICSAPELAEYGASW